MLCVIGRECIASLVRYTWSCVCTYGHDCIELLILATSNNYDHRHWCMKEAYIKALGIGLGFDLHRVEFHYHEDLIWGDIAYVYIDGIYQARWQFFLHKLDSDHWVSLHLTLFTRVFSCVSLH